MGDDGLDIVTAFHYDANHQSAMNKKFVAAYNAEFKRNPDMFSVGGYDGMHVIYEALKKTNGDTASDKLIAAMEGLSFDTPKGPMTFRKEDHQAMQSMYHFRVAKGAKQGAQADLELVNEIKPADMNVPIRNKR